MNGKTDQAIEVAGGSVNGTPSLRCWPRIGYVRNLYSLRSLLFDFKHSWLGRELAPFPGRETMTLHQVVAVVAVTIVPMALQTLSTAISAYFVFFVTKEKRVI